MIDYKQQLSDLESLASEVDYDMTEYDQAKIDELATMAKEVAQTIYDLFGARHYDISAIINNAQAVADTDRDEWEGNNL